MILALLALFLAAATPVDEVVAAERSFAAMAKEKGVSPAFRAFVAEEGILFVPFPKRAGPLLKAAPDRPGSLVWWPVYAGMAASADLGFTTGPFVKNHGELYGHYFTVWRKQSDGSWRWLLDHGPSTDEASLLGPDTQVVALPAGEPSADAWNEVLEAERALAAALAADARAAYAKVFDADSRLMRVGPQPAIGAAAITAALAREPERLETSHLGGAASQAGDLAYTYGDIRWNDAEGEKRGHYVRIWQHRSRGWTLIVDNVIPVPPR